MTKTTYNVGDKVQVLNARGIVGGSILKDIATVDRLLSNGQPFLDGLLIAEDELHCIKKIESPTKLQSFKLGDQVRILSVVGIDCASPYYNVGDITTVVGTDADGDPRIARYKGDTHGLVILRSERKHLEKVSTVDAKIADKIASHGYKVGDKMRILDASGIWGGHRLTDGQVCEVTEISRHGNPKIRTGSGSDLAIVIGEIESGYVEKVVEPKPTAYEEYRVGDKVRILNVDGIMFGSAYWKNGDITTVVSSGGLGRSLRLDRKDGRSQGLIITEREVAHFEKVEAPTEVLRRGDYVRILDVGKIMFGERYWKTGDLVKVTRGTSTYGHTHLDRQNGSEDGLLIKECELPYIEKVEVAQAVAPRISEPIPTTHTRVLDLEAKVEQLEAKVQALETGNVDVIYTASFADPVYVPTAPTKNVERAAVIAKAKKFVSDITASMSSGAREHRGNETFQHRLTIPQFEVNGRTVSVTIIGANNPVTYETASATAAPGDVFNRHIGEAIALGRALGLDVPAEFTKAPKPTHLVVGTVTRGRTIVGIETTARVEDGKAYDKNGKWWDEKIEDSSFLIVLEDTNADYGMGEF